jgi:hypothetical protein
MNDFYLGSKEEEANKGSNPLESEDYIIKIAKIDLAKAPSFDNGTPNWNRMVLTFKTVCLPYALKAGGVMKDNRGKDVEPLTRFIFRDINPFSTGFQPDKVTPAFTRAIIAYMEGTPIDQRLKSPDFVLIDPNGNVVTDPALRKAFLAEVSSTDIERKLISKGYQAIPDLRAYEGRYIGCAMEIDTKTGRNKITKLSKLPSTFAPPTAEFEKPLLEKFMESYTKMKRKSDERDSQKMAEAKSGVGLGGSVMAEDIDGEIEKEEIKY